MNSRQLQKLGIPEHCVKAAVLAIQSYVREARARGRDIKERLQSVLAAPTDFLQDPHFGELARELAADSVHDPAAPREPITYRTWGTQIDGAAHAQMRQACGVPMAAAAALMPDAHVGYGLPIGGVLALENAVIPYAVGVDIACRMKLSILDLPVDSLNDKWHRYEDVLERGTRFGVGSAYETPKDHPVMDQDWTVSRITREKKDVARRQLGTSGSGNHFAEFGELHLPADNAQINLAAGRYVALLSHSGSRGTGAAVCSTYSGIARAKLPRRYADFAYLAWLSMESEEGQEYWAAMNLMGDYAAANHDVIHRSVSKLLGARIIAGVENHHNFAWKEIHDGREWIVHRKGATPAGKGVLGVIPGSMASPAYLVRGKGVPESIESASHGAGRCMSRTAARGKFAWKSVQRDLEQRGVHVISAGADEVPGVYKDIDLVMREQADLVEIVARFDPRVVKMCGDGSKAED